MTAVNKTAFVAIKLKLLGSPTTVSQYDCSIINHSQTVYHLFYYNTNHWDDALHPKGVPRVKYEASSMGHDRGFFFFFLQPEESPPFERMH